ncbi:PR-1-like protein [Cadophora sp. DSE1049]|nr:PR-1-like protein [Cadophora sp. DSE1049]
MSATSREAQAALDLHNKARREALGGCRPDLVWSRSLEAIAEAYAKKLVRMNRGMIHDPRAAELNMGENLTMGEYSPKLLVLTLTESTRGWVNEEKWYKGEPVSRTMKDNRGNQWGHYTQVISTRCTKVGIAYASGHNVQFVVARPSQWFNSFAKTQEEREEVFPWQPLWRHHEWEFLIKEELWMSQGKCGLGEV